MISISTIETHYVSNKLNKKFVTSSNIELSTAEYSREILNSNVDSEELVSHGRVNKNTKLRRGRGREEIKTMKMYTKYLRTL